MTTSYLVGLGMCLLGLVIRTSYELLKKAGKANMESPLLFAVVFVAMCLMLVSWPIMCSSDPIRLVSLGPIHSIGLGAWIIGLGLALAALIQLRGVENIDHLVTTGLFSKFRHPMYLGFIFWITGWVIFSGAVISLVIGLVGIGNILFWRRLEEDKLSECYGEVYQKYRQRTWF
jgi:protein-S-isoprenylcysteine O-methyltransferase Ste14